jgi:LAO/AO transport system kinase
MLQSVLNRDIRACARLIRMIDDDLEQGKDLLKQLFKNTGKSYIVGITGNPGTGKSTLTDKLIGHYREQGKSVAVVAIDPSSPFSGGAILGDRIRMQKHATDPEVFIRSFGTRGHLGGLTSTTPDVVIALDAMGWDVILVETVGVGQDEVEIQRLAHTTVVVMAPGLGDEIQAIKAGILEIADIFVVNKADRAEADRTVRELSIMLDIGHAASSDQPQPWIADDPDMLKSRVSPTSWTPKILKTVAVKGEGVDELVEGLKQHREAFKEAASQPEFVRARMRQEFINIYRRVLFSKGFSDLRRNNKLEEIVDKLVTRSSDPYTLAEEAVDALVDALGRAG